MAGFAHICVVLVSGSRLLCLVVHISSKGAKADNTEGQQGKKKKGNQTRYRNFVCGRRSKSHGALSSSPASLLSYALACDTLLNAENQSHVFAY